MDKPVEYNQNNLEQPLYQTGQQIPYQASNQTPMPEPQPVKRRFKLSRFFLALLLFSILNFGVLFVAHLIMNGQGPTGINLMASEFLMTALFASLVMTILASIPANRPLRVLKNLVRVIAIVLAFALAWANGTGYYFQNEFMYQDLPYEQEDLDEASADSQLERIEIRLSNDKIMGGWIWKNAGDSAKQPLLLYFGGNGEESTSSILKFKESRTEAFKGYNVMTIDYPEYGLSKGPEGENYIFEFAEAAYAYAKQLPYVDTDRIVIGAWSIGTGTAVRLAAKVQPNGLLLIAPFQNGRKLVYGFAKNILDLDIPIPLLMRNSYKSERYAEQYHGPTLVLASQNDQVIASEQSEALNEHFSNSEMLLRDGISHSGFWNDEASVAKITQFMASLK